MGSASQPSDKDNNYFVCTLGQAAQQLSLSGDDIFDFRTVNEFVDRQATRVPKLPAVGFPIPQQIGLWQTQVFCEFPGFCQVFLLWLRLNTAVCYELAWSLLYYFNSVDPLSKMAWYGDPGD